MMMTQYDLCQQLLRMKLIIMANQIVTYMTLLEKTLSIRICFCLVILAISVSCAYYGNGTKSVLNPIQEVVWTSDDYISYKTDKGMYVTESLEVTDEEQYEIYFSQLQPKQQNIDYFYTPQRTPTWDMRVPFLSRDNLPQCWLDSNDIQGISIQKILINSANIYLLQNKSKIRINTLHIPDIVDQSQQSYIPDCLHQRYNWTNKNNDNYIYKEFLSLYHRQQLAVTYYDHIQVLFLNSKGQFVVLQTIDFLVVDGVKLTSENEKQYEFYYYVNDEESYQQQYQQQMIVIVINQQLWVYHRQGQAQKFVFTNKIRLNQTILQIQITSYQEAYVLIEDDCSVYKILLVDEKQQPIKIVSLSTLCSTTLVDLQLGVRENGDIIIVGVQNITGYNLQQSAPLQQQLTIYVVPIHTPTPTSSKLNQDKIYHITLSHKQQQQFHLLTYHFITQTDYIFLLLQQPDTNKAQLFIGFDIGRLIENEAVVLGLQWQWMSQRFQNGVEDYSIDETGIVVLEYDPLTKVQDLSWYKTVIIVGSAYYRLQQPLTISRVNTLAFYQNTVQSTITAYDFVHDQIHYKLSNSNSQFIASSPSGNLTILINSQDFKKIDVYEKQLFLGTIQLEHQINPQTTLLQFMNDSIIVQISSIGQSPQTTHFVVNGYVIDFTKENKQFKYKILKQLKLPSLNHQQIKINSYNLIYLNLNQGKIVILQAGQEEFQVEQEIQLSSSIDNVKQLKLGLSEEGNIYAVEGGQEKVYQYVYCEQFQYFDKGECLHTPITPDPHPFPIITIIAGAIGGLAIIVIVTYQIMRYKAYQRRGELVRSLIESQQGERNPQVIKQSMQNISIEGN